MYLAVVTVTGPQGTSTTEIALPISAGECGEAPGTTPPTYMGISAASVKGKFFFSPVKMDAVTFKGTIELPAGLDLSKAQTLFVSLGNVLDTANLNTKGQASAGQKNRLKKVAVKYPKLKKPATLTNAGQKATVSFTLSAIRLDTLGFGAEGVSSPATTLFPIVQAALVLGGTAYRADIPSSWKLSKKGDSGQLTGKN
ncbi:MAG: hypothetical protein ABSE73_09000 [Planctomycetota bacterium]